MSSETGGGLPGTLLPVFLLSILVSSLDSVVLFHTGRTCKKPQHQAVGNKCYTTVSFKFQLAIFRYLCRLFAVCVLMLHLTGFYILAGLLLTLANIGEVGMAVSSPLFFCSSLFFLICGKTHDLLLNHAPYEMRITGIGIEGSKARCMWVCFKID